MIEHKFSAANGDKVLHEWLHQGQLWRLTVVNGIVRAEEHQRGNWYMADPKFAGDALLMGLRQLVGTGTTPSVTPDDPQGFSEGAKGKRWCVIGPSDGRISVKDKAFVGKRIFVWTQVDSPAPETNLKGAIHESPGCQKGFQHKHTAPECQPGFKHKAPWQIQLEKEKARKPWGVE